MNNEIRSHVLWLDVNAKIQECYKRRRLSEAPISSFTNINECEEYIRHNEHDQIILIVNDSLTPDIINRFHSLRSVSAMYIRLPNNENHEKWNSKLRKVWYIENSIEADELMNKIRDDEKRRTYWLESVGMNSFQVNTIDIEENTSAEIDGAFLHSQLLLDSLLTMSPSSTEKSSAIAYFREEYGNNSSILEQINKFESTYLPDQALFWYTQNSFFYSTLNKAFRIQNIDALYQMRIFIRDIRDRLVEQQCSLPSSGIQVYRGQLISKVELERFEIGELISINSFFSTTLERTYASFLLPEGNQEGDLTSVLFEISINEYSSSTKPFANISEKSAFPNELEVLFMAGSIFRITGIDLNTNGINMIKLLLCRDDDHNLKKLFEHMREDIPPQSIPLTYGIVLANAGKVEQAERFFRNVLKELTSDDPTIVDVFHQLGNVLDDRGNFSKSLEYYEKSVSRKLEILPKDSPSIANTYVCCGVAYLRNNELDRALEFYQKAMDIYKKAYGDDDEDVAMCLYNIANIKMFQKQYEESLGIYKRALTIWSKCLPENHPDIGRSHMSIADVQSVLLLGDEALEHYKKALDIMTDSLPPVHHQLALLYDGIGKLYYSTNDNQTAEEYFEASLEVKKQLYSEDHQAMADSYHNIGLTYKAKGDHQQAVSYLTQAFTIQNKYFSSDHEASIRLSNDLEEAKAAFV